jgi:hypothetical protein
MAVFALIIYAGALSGDFLNLKAGPFHPNWKDVLAWGAAVVLFASVVWLGTELYTSYGTPAERAWRARSGPAGGAALAPVSCHQHYPQHRLEQSARLAAAQGRILHRDTEILIVCGRFCKLG